MCHSFLVAYLKNEIFCVLSDLRSSALIKYSDFVQNLKSAEVQLDSKSPDASLRMEPEIIIITFQKVKNSLGLSIVAAKVS